MARTPLHDWHVAHGGKMVDFAGWQMPLYYASIGQEHGSTRLRAALFDVSHMGRFRFDGPGAAALLDHLLTRRVTDLAPGKIRYSLVTNAQGGILDDVLIYCLRDTSGKLFHWMVVNAGNRQKIADWISGHLPSRKDVVFRDVTAQTAMIAVQGPRALETGQPLFSFSLSNLDYYSGQATTLLGSETIVSRTGYTGEDGCEIIVSRDVAHEVWESLLSSGAAHEVMPAGLGARDTLRLEAALPLYGHELTEEIDPYQAGLNFAVNLEDRNFVGRDSLARRKSEASPLRRIGLRLTGKRIARQHCRIYGGTHCVGEVTSGTFSPTLQQSIAMGYVQPAFCEPGTELSVDIRGRSTPAEVVRLPFYRRP